MVSVLRVPRVVSAATKPLLDVRAEIVPLSKDRCEETYIAKVYIQGSMLGTDDLLTFERPAPADGGARVRRGLFVRVGEGDPKEFSDKFALVLSRTANITGAVPGKDKRLAGLAPQFGKGFLVYAGKVRIFVQSVNLRFLNVYVSGLADFGDDIGGVLGFASSQKQDVFKHACESSKDKIAALLRVAEDGANHSNRREGQSILRAYL